jgi:hypothetical protein
MSDDLLLEQIIANGNRGHTKRGNWVKCVDGFKLSVIAGGGTYCTPRPDICIYPVETTLCSRSLGRRGILEDVSCSYDGPYSHLEIGYPSECPEPWEIWSEFVEDKDDPTETVYAYVPVEDVRALVELHGGEVPGNGGETR